MALVEVGAKYTLTGPDGTNAVFNLSTDPDYIGMLTDLTGFDSPEVRESADDLVQADGGIHGDFYYGRRPITMTGLVLNPASATERNVRLEKLSRASDALRNDAILRWTPSGGVERYMRLRRQQPLRFSGAWQKEFQIALVAADPRIYSYALQSAEVAAQPVDLSTVGRQYDRQYDTSYGPMAPNGQLLVTNAGSTLTYPLLTIYGPGANPSVTNVTTNETIYLNYVLADTETLVIDTLNRTVLLNGSAGRYNAVDFARTDWFGMVPGVNDIRIAFASYSTGAKLNVAWRDAWM